MDNSWTNKNYFQKKLNRIEDPRSKQRGTGTKWNLEQLIFDPMEFFILSPPGFN